MLSIRRPRPCARAAELEILCSVKPAKAVCATGARVRLTPHTTREGRGLVPMTGVQARVGLASELGEQTPPSLGAQL